MLIAKIALDEMVSFGFQTTSGKEKYFSHRVKGVQIIADPEKKFGTCATFDGNGSGITFQNVPSPTRFSVREASAFTLAAWVRKSETKARGTVVEIGQNHPGIRFYSGKLQLFQNYDMYASKRQDFGLSWNHVVVTQDDSSSRLFVNGTLVQTDKAVAGTGGGWLNIGCHRKDGGNTIIEENHFKGDIRDVLIFDEPVTVHAAQNVIRLGLSDGSFMVVSPQPAAVRQVPEISKLELVNESVSPQRATVRPVPGILKLDLVNDDDEPVLYIKPDRDLQQLSLSIENTSSGAIKLLDKKGSQVGPECFHFQLHLRHGTLDTTFRKDLAGGTGNTFAALKALGWSVHFEDLGTKGDRISLLWTGAITPGDPSYLLKGSIDAAQRVLLPLADVRVKAGAGSRTTRVLLSYDNLQCADETMLPRGQRIELLNILFRQQGSMERLVDGIKKNQLTTYADMPLEIKVEGSLLNDGGANSLKVKIKNARLSAGNSAAIDMGTDGATDATPKLWLAMDALFDNRYGSSSDDFTNILVSVTSSRKPSEELLKRLLKELSADLYLSKWPEIPKNLSEKLLKERSEKQQLSKELETQLSKELETQLSKGLETQLSSKFLKERSQKLSGVILKELWKELSQAPSWSVTASSDSKRWSLTPPKGNMLSGDEELTVTLSNLKTTEESGTIYLTVGYEDILEYGEDEYYIPIKVAPLSFSRIEERETVVIQSATVRGDLTLKGNVKGNLGVQGRINDRTGVVMPVGAIIAFGGGTAPDGWLLCNGAKISTDAKYDELRKVLSPQTTVPDLRGRFILGAGEGSGLTSRILHATGGTESVTLSKDEMPSHKHGLRTAISQAANAGWGKSTTSFNWSLKVTDLGTEDSENVKYRDTPFSNAEGGGKAHGNMPPFYVLTYVIKY